MLNSCRGCLLFLVLCPFAILQAGAEVGEDYRLTGIMGSDSGKAFAVLENSTGEQHLVTEGNAVGVGYVKSISSQYKIVILAFPDGDIELRLTGSGLPNTLDPEKEENDQPYSMSDYSDAPEQRTLDKTAVSKLRKLAGNPGKLDETQLSARVNEVLGLPSETRIAAYDDQKVDSARDLLAQLNKKVSDTTSADTLGTISVSDRTGRRRVYLMADSEAD